MVVECLGGQLGMEFAGLAIHAWAVVVVDAIGDIAGLLDLGEHDAATDGMYTACREVEDIASLDLMVGKDLCDASVLNPLLIFIRGNVLLETGIEMGAFFRLDDIPHLGLAHLAMFALCHLIIGMYLDAQVALGIDELHQ